MKHTPLPWIIAHQKGEFDDAYWVGPDEHFTVCKVEHGAEDDEYGGPEAELGNAKLIVTAVNSYYAMREALKAAHFYIDASDQELYELNISREDALRQARELLEQTKEEK